MKVLFLNTFDIEGGAARAAFRLMKGVRSKGIQAQMLVQKRISNDNVVIGPRTRTGKAVGLIRSHMDSLCTKLYPNRKKIIFSPAILPDNLPLRVADLQPDIIHLHWVAGGFLRIETLKRFNMPLIWTLHDSWAFTGGCHIPFDCKRYLQSCGKCPTLGSLRECDLSRWIWQRKKKAWKSLNLTIVTPSHWLANCAKSSSLFSDVRVEVIPNGLNLQTYKPIDKHVARELLSLPQGKKLILFGGVNSTSDWNKGFHLLVPALQNLVEKGWYERIALVIFGSSEPADIPDFGLVTKYLGRLYDEVSIALLYAEVDVLVLPSIQEDLPNSVV